MLKLHSTSLLRVGTDIVCTRGESNVLIWPGGGAPHLYYMVGDVVLLGGSGGGRIWRYL